MSLNDLAKGKEEMITNKPNNSLAAIIAFGLMLSIAYSAVARSRVSPAPFATPGAFQNPDIHTIKDAGLQYELPKGWKVETQENGNIFVSFEDGAASATFVVEDNYAEVVTGMKSGLKERLTGLKSDGESKQDTHNGMIHISESGTGMMEGVKISWSIDVLKAGKSVTMLTFGIESVLQSHIAEYEKFVGSIKKI
jgi:hypothetical protein